MKGLTNLSKVICLLILILGYQTGDTDILFQIDTVAPRFKNRVKPDYPKNAQRLQMEGTVILQAIIDVTGIPKDIIALTNLGFGLEKAAIEALKKTTFHPAIQDGKPVSIRVEIPYDFKLDTFNMTLIPAGKFLMGSNKGDSDEKPVHTVYVDAFYMDIYEVTNAEYKKFVDANPQWQKNQIPRAYHDGDYLKDWNDNNYPSGKGNYPVVHVSWYAAVAYAGWVGKRLPTEAEWERAVRGRPIDKQYPWDNSIAPNKAKYKRHIGKATPVGTYPTLSNYGLHDMTGNVQEWCLDEYNSEFYADSPTLNPLSGAGSVPEIVNNFTNLIHDRVLRGGSYSDVWKARITDRTRFSPTNTSLDVGFRCVRSKTPPKRENTRPSKRIPFKSIPNR